ncbi:uncharacterized protein EI90DRAFT_3119982 [Cantharellus anzutake]|uniref:uncharacterized protein n=1 Tax=Cantharellus anzutake TaxID=1750568 RepID=UPI0019032FF6|nr:uncharacterized protein EI90DRAFT_3119982 [Cantharellus anzutake]KAF8335695.1 hypothetical protein EI90DRAFT_3119982 [Cantharellus anzutake]
MSQPIVLAQLEYAVYRILHAHQFCKSSRRQMNILVDLLARYLELLASTCKIYAEHAGRGTGNIFDAVSALRELGVDISELAQWHNREGSVIPQSQRPTSRLEDLGHVRAILDEGRRSDATDSMLMTYQRLPSPVSDVDPTTLDPVAEISFDSVHSSYIHLPNGCPNSPTLPPSPISNSSPIGSPVLGRRRLRRQATWASSPPDYVPSFLPPFPGHATGQIEDDDELPLVNGIYEGPDDMLVDPVHHVSDPSSSHTQSKEMAIVKQHAVPAFKESIPYYASTLSGIPAAHLPPAPQRELNHKSASLASHPYLLVAMQAASEIVGTPNPARLAITSILSSSAAQRYSAVDTLYSSSQPNAPRHLPPAPSYAVPMKPETHPNAALPTSFNPRSIKTSSPLNPIPPYTHPRIQAVAEQISRPGVYERSTHIIPPPAFSDATSGVSSPRLHGRPQRAPWNSLLPQHGSNPEKAQPHLPDAWLYNTWDHNLGSFEEPLRKSKTTSGMPKSVDEIGTANEDAMLVDPTLVAKEVESVKITSSFSLPHPQVTPNV